MQQSTAMLVVRVALVFLFAFAMIMAGIALDALAGTSPAGALAFLGFGVIFGTVMIVITILSTFPRPPAEDAPEAKGVENKGE